MRPAICGAHPVMDVVRPVALPGSGAPVARAGPTMGMGMGTGTGTADAGVTAGAVGVDAVVAEVAVAAETEGAHSW
ncbi:hypothetical protein QN239_20385 [Mycolicibacterium sp. Y3]